MLTETLTEFKFIKSEPNSEYETDVQCENCNETRAISITREFNSKWHIYSNPNYELIDGSLKGYSEYKYIQPDAIKFILDNMSGIRCPNCQENKLKITFDSKYNPDRILESLDCHLYS